MPSRARLAIIGLVSLVAACGERPDRAAPPASSASAPASSNAGEFHRFTVGELQAIALRDGAGAVPNDNKVFAVGRTPQEVATVLAAAGVPTDTLALSIQTLLVRSGDQLVLLDTGGGAAYPGAGKLPASLQAAGITPDQITDIVLSHTHGDHVGGLVTAADALAFPKAKIHLAADEWADLRAKPDQKGLVRVIQAQVYAAAPGAQIAPGLKTFSSKATPPATWAWRSPPATSA
jgi:glyoxylase-like metal-dependent hydrolase (beta-lactamase superfamily II)